MSCYLSGKFKTQVVKLCGGGRGQAAMRELGVLMMPFGNVMKAEAPFHRGKKY